MGRPVKRASLARTVGVSVSSLYAYLSGSTLPPTDVLDRLLGALAVPAAEQRRLTTARDDLEIAVSAADPDSTVGSSAQEPAATGEEVPRELPADVFAFTGRARQLALLNRLLPAAGERSPAMVISVLSGTAGVGKTALAVHWAHRVRDHFGDGQLYLDLRGYHPDHPRHPTEALETLLRSLGVPGSNIPPTQADRAARYRSLVTDRQMLVVLDNARSAEQVRDLLPGTASCFVVVTSRDSLAGLIARDGAQRIEVDLLGPEDAVALLATLVGDRVRAEPAAAAELAQRCARLPLALRVAAERAAAHADITLADLVGELDRHRLDVFGAGGDPRAAVRSVFSWSYRHLPAGAGHVFRAFGVHPGPDVDAHSAAALTGTDPDTARSRLGALRQAHLAYEPVPGRYAVHDLLRAYAGELANEPEATVAVPEHPALTGLFDYYTRTAAVAAGVAYPHEDQPGGDLVADVAGPPLDSPQRALAWLDAERANLIAVAACAAGHGQPRRTVDLSASLHRHLLIRGQFTDAHALHTQALHAVGALGDRDAQSRIRNDMGITCHRLGRHDDALDHLQAALALARETGNLGQQARALGNIGIVYEKFGWYSRALEQHQEQLAITRRIGDRAGAARALSNSGIAYEMLGRHADALDQHQQRLRMAREAADPVGEVHALANVGNAHARLGRYGEAGRHHRRALRISREAGYRYGEAYVLVYLAADLRCSGRPDQAAEHCREALRIAREVGDRNAEFEALDGLARTLHDTGRHREALARHNDALAIVGELDQPHDRARTHDGIARNHRALGQADLAYRHWQRALAIYRALGVAEAEQVRAELAGIGSGGGTGRPPRR